MNQIMQAISALIGSSYISEDEIPPIKADTWYADLLSSISEDAQILVEIAINGPIEMASSSYSVCQRFERYMKTKFNWPYQKTAKAFYEIKGYLHEG